MVVSLDRLLWLFTLSSVVLRGKRIRSCDTDRSSKRKSSAALIAVSPVPNMISTIARAVQIRKERNRSVALVQLGSLRGYSPNGESWTPLLKGRSRRQLLIGIDGVRNSTEVEKTALYA